MRQRFVPSKFSSGHSDDMDETDFRKAARRLVRSRAHVSHATRRFERIVFAELRVAIGE